MVMFTYLQHSDPTIPYYRKVRASSHKTTGKKVGDILQSEWSFSRGALATVDRPVFGWVGRYVLHNVRMLDLQ